MLLPKSPDNSQLVNQLNPQETIITAESLIFNYSRGTLFFHFENREIVIFLAEVGQKVLPNEEEPILQTEETIQFVTSLILKNKVTLPVRIVKLLNESYKKYKLDEEKTYQTIASLNESLNLGFSVPKPEVLDEPEMEVEADSLFSISVPNLDDFTKKELQQYLGSIMTARSQELEIEPSSNTSPQLPEKL
ncbi:MAG: hypothetical protein OHK0017_01040 [Patescibacteria group bacterium]